MHSDIKRTMARIYKTIKYMTIFTVLFLGYCLCVCKIQSSRAKFGTIIINRNFCRNLY